MFPISPKAAELREKLLAFMDEHIYPNEPVMKALQAERENRWTHPPLLDELKASIENFL